MCPWAVYKPCFAQQLTSLRDKEFLPADVEEVTSPESSDSENSENEDVKTI